ncbi:MAG: hypothetical protein QXU82_01450 [Candidatus Aenigmatarchaeota archaeon]
MISAMTFLMIVIVAIALLLTGLIVMGVFSGQAADPAQGLVDFFNSLLRRGY